MKYTTTLKRLNDNNACSRGYDLIANHVGQGFSGDIDLLTILEVNGLSDCIWALRATDGGKELAVAFAIYCAEPYYTEPAWVKWASGWMACVDRSANAAANADANAANAANAAAYAAANAAYAAANADAYAADKKRQVAIMRKLLGGEA